MTAHARAIAEQAYKHAIRLGHPYLGGERSPWRPPTSRPATVAWLASLPSGALTRQPPPARAIHARTTASPGRCR